MPGNRAHGVEDQNSSCSNTRAAKQKRNPAGGMVLLLDFSFYRTNRDLIQYSPPYQVRAAMSVGAGGPVMPFKVALTFSRGLTPGLRKIWLSGTRRTTSVPVRLLFCVSRYCERRRG